MNYIYKKKTFSPVGDEKIPDGEYILITNDNVSALIIATEKFQRLITAESAGLPDVSRLLRLIFVHSYEISCKKGKIQFEFFKEGEFLADGKDGFYTVKNSSPTANLMPPHPLRGIIEKYL